MKRLARMKRLAPLLAAAGLLATTVPLLSATGAAASVPLSHPASSAPASAYGDALARQPSWHRCAADRPAAYECATIKVPLDHQRPRGPLLDLAISRIKSENPAKRHGVLLLNPGGPGGAGLDLPLQILDVLPPEVRDRYDLIGFDPRGVGASSPVSCGLDAAEQSVDRPYHPETFAADVAWARTVADKCRARAGAVLPYLTTRDTARDMDTIRSALGERRISYLGYSYGTYLGAVYTQLFPDRADRFVLDSGVDPGRVWRDMMRTWATEAGPAFDRWTRWTAGRDAEFHLGATPAAVSATFWALVARADRDPIEFQGEKLTGDSIRAARPLFFSPARAAPLIAAVKAAADGTPPPAGVPSLRAALGAARSAAGEPASDNGLAVFWSVVCGDTDDWPRDPERYRSDAVRDKAAYPLYGDFASNIKPCAFWQRPLEPVTAVRTRADVLTVQNEWDSQTPLVSGEGLHRALRGSRMVLALGGEGHGVYLADPGSCVTATVTGYLATGRLPARDVNCRAATPPPGERRTGPGLPLPSAPDRF
ncbi:alpha/beta hydrolase [Streptomyces sp. NBC_00536]|uniref:alpha/beta hydrolase n=1 Tax=Streptomyces sp. NBC_00536 TaxID=2975769 RepID=UPI002E8030C3|nr:alpha/beta hydrolase [Streptomyces sp. NBC_00536]WUC83975.1 alpha/beta hydrolase [Streptomyces sp. NBC_00536]